MTYVRRAAAAVLAALAVVLGVAGWRWPLEAGSVLFAPLLLGAAAFCLAGAVALVLPPRAARPPRQSPSPAVLVMVAVLGVAMVVQWIV